MLTFRETKIRLSELLEHNIPRDAMRDLTRLIAHIKRLRWEDVYINYKNIELTSEELSLFKQAHERYKQNEPVSKILQQRAFWKHVFFINHDVLDPRPETELIIESVLSLFASDSRINILDIGTGSGCILLSLLQEFPNATGIGIDISDAAIKVANTNKSIMQIDNAKFEQCSWNTYRPESQFTVIVSNPPYIKTADIDDLSPNVKLYDPLIALDGGATGLTAYEEISSLAPNWLQPNGFLILEIGYGQSEQVINILQKSMFKIIDVKRDLSGIERTIIAQNK